MTRRECDFLQTLQSLPRHENAIKMATVRASMTQWLSLPDFKQTMDGLEEQEFFERINENGIPFLYPDAAMIAFALYPPVPAVAKPGSRSRRSPLAECLIALRG